MPDPGLLSLVTDGASDTTASERRPQAQGSVLGLLWKADPPPVHMKGSPHHCCGCVFIISTRHTTFEPWAPGPHTLHLPRCHHPLHTMLQTLHLLLRAAESPGLTSVSFHPRSQPSQAFPAKLGFVPGEGRTLMQTMGAGEGLAGRWTLGRLWYHAVPDPCGGCNVYPWYKHHETWLHVLLPRLTQHVALGKAFATSFFLSPCLSVLSNYAKAFQGRDHFSLGSDTEWLEVLLDTINT